jgi:galactokinase
VAVVDPGALAAAFEAAFGRPPRLYRAPGRVNLIGEHTDYNDGFVMPMALDRCVWVAAAPRDDRTIVVGSREYAETVTIDLGAPRSRGTHQRARWDDYVLGIATVLSEAAGAEPAPHGAGRGRPLRAGGADMLIASDVPIGAGLSSSAALEVACGFALADLAGLALDLDALARMAQRAEHEFAGTRCGIMDQMIACHGRAGQVLQLDTRTLECVHVPLPSRVRVLVCNTMVAHELASAEYNARRADCEAGVRALSARFSGTRALRDATLEQLDAARGDMTPQVWRRCRHVVTENARVLQAAAALRRSDFAGFGALMSASHESLRDDYEVSCPELDVMAATVSDLDGVFGARMTGGGFGGCVVALVEAHAVDDRLGETIRERYQANTGILPEVWMCAAGDGVQRVAAWPQPTETIGRADTGTQRA